MKWYYFIDSIIGNMDSSEIMKNLVSSNQIKLPKYTIVSERERERLYEELYDDTPYILFYYNKKEIEERQKIEQERYIKSKHRNHF